MDRDGVINVEKNYVYKIEDFEFIDGVFETLRHFQTLGYFLIIITNQAGIARGYYSELALLDLTEWMLDQFRTNDVFISKVYYSAYHPEHGLGKYKKDSLYRKPNPGMILRAKLDLDLDLAHSLLVGDKETDIEAGINAGIRTNVLFDSGYTKQFSKADFIIRSVLDMIKIVGNREGV